MGCYDDYNDFEEEYQVDHQNTDFCEQVPVDQQYLWLILYRPETDTRLTVRVGRYPSDMKASYCTKTFYPGWTLIGTEVKDHC